MKNIFTLILGVILLTSCQAKSIDLKFNLEKGKEYKQVTSSKISIIQEINGQKINMGMTLNGNMTFLVKAVNSNNYNMDVKFTQLSMAMQMPQGTVEFSSEKNDANDIFSSILSAMKNKAFSITMSKSGKVLDVNKVDFLWEAAINEFKQLSDIQKQQIKAQIVKAYGAKALKGNIEMVTAIYPNKSVNKGDQWTVNTQLESGMSANMTTNYEFSDLTSEYAFIKGNSTIKTANKEAYVNTNGMPMKYDLTGTMLSEIKVDKNTGWILEAKMNQEIKGDAIIKENPQLPNGMKIPMTMKSEMLITNK
jgi:hypothetical protein